MVMDGGELHIQHLYQDFDSIFNKVIHAGLPVKLQHLINEVCGHACVSNFFCCCYVAV